MESQGIKHQKKYIEAFFKCVASELFPSLLLALVSLLLLPFSSFCICAFFHSSPWLCTE